jgi:hypothetical protein
MTCHRSFSYPFNLIRFFFSNLSVNDYRTEMPRNESLSVIVCESLPPVSVGDCFEQTYSLYSNCYLQPVRRYSRQLLESDIDMSSKQPRLRRYMNRWTNPIEEDADTNTFPLERRCRSLRVPQRRNTTAISMCCFCSIPIIVIDRTKR